MTEHFHTIDSTLPPAKNYEIGLVITTYNRPYYLHKTLESLRKSKLPDTIILLVDDGSNNLHTLGLLTQFTLTDTPVVKLIRKEKNGCLMFENLQIGWDYLLAKYHCTYLVNLDSDVQVKPDWLLTLKNLHQQQKRKHSSVLVTGFNAYQHPITKESKDHYHKSSLGGINFFFDTHLYQKIVKPSLTDLHWDDRVGIAMKYFSYPIVCTKPSVIQHIGRQGLWSGVRSGTFDFAIDYGDVNPIRMKARLFWFERSKQVFKQLSTFFLYSKLTLASLRYRLLFWRLYSPIKKS